MQKPFSMMYEDTKRAIAEIVTNSELPPYVLRDMFISLTENLQEACRVTYERDKELYEKGGSEGDSSN